MEWHVGSTMSCCGEVGGEKSWLVLARRDALLVTTTSYTAKYIYTICCRCNVVKSWPSTIPLTTRDHHMRGPDGQSRRLQRLR